jgi:RNA polymerase subunit RPABC4/transcription elongation factor Spt4
MPPKTRKADLRACLICSVIRPLAEFVDEGCPNCEDILEVRPMPKSLELYYTNEQMRGQPERVAECTSINFDGMIAMMDPDGSWVAKWQRISKLRNHWTRSIADGQTKRQRVCTRLE